MDITGIGEVATAAQKILGMIFPDKTEEEKEKLAAAMAMLSAQTDIDKAEAQSSDPLQHWRGGLGWVCTLAYAWTFILHPVIAVGVTLAGHPDVAAKLPALDIAPLSALTLGMLGLGAMHVTESIKGAT